MVVGSVRQKDTIKGSKVREKIEREEGKIITGQRAQWIFPSFFQERLVKIDRSVGRANQLPLTIARFDQYWMERRYCSAV
jgi:hypothetical protein